MEKREPFKLEPGAKEAMVTIPTHLRAGLLRYVEDGIQPGRFLCAIIDNDFGEAIARAGAGVTVAHLRAVHAWLYNYTTTVCCGTESKRLAWQETVGKGLPAPEPDDEDEFP